MGFRSWAVQREGVGAAEHDLHSSISEGWATQHPQSLPGAFPGPSPAQLCLKGMRGGEPG